ncbi:hypothetical protein [Vibrio vulnificus]|uniref:hypothetical protein n=1 Tax=Vibrio vulnificus TaxID=672 RepID=UPI001028A5E8|nr:hypothetical protein [Vibrio vulnificus]RZP84930.1 hypothetical protein D8T54_23850 [Vibrio vulnificus]
MKPYIVSGGMLLLLMVESAHSSNVISHTFAPQITLFNDSVSESIEIQAPQLSFVTPYSHKEQSFSQLTVPFDVVSLSGAAVDYRLSLPISMHFCESSGAEATPLNGVSVKLDNQTWPSLEDAPFHSARGKHFMTISYPMITQSEVNQFCYGTLGVQVENVTL